MADDKKAGWQPRPTLAGPVTMAAAAATAKEKRKGRRIEQEELVVRNGKEVAKRKGGKTTKANQRQPSF